MAALPSFSNNALHADGHAIAIASNPQIVYTGNDGGIWRSTNNGNTWQTPQRRFQCYAASVSALPVLTGTS